MFYFCFSRVLLTSLLHSFDSLGKTLLEDIGIVHMYGVASWRALVPSCVDLDPSYLEKQ